MSNSNDVNEQSGSPRDSRNSGNTTGMSVPSVVPVTVKPVDRKTIEGSYPGDSRAQAAPAVLPAQPGPRGETEQAGS